MISSLYQSDDRPCGVAGIDPLLNDSSLLSCTDERVATHGDEHGLHKSVVSGQCQFPANHGNFLSRVPSRTQQLCLAYRLKHFAVVHEFQQNRFLRMQAILRLLVNN